MVNRIALISYHNELNYGTMLQAYALYRALKMQGVDSEYITYQSSAPSLKRHLLQCLNRYLFHPKNLYDRVVRRKGSQDDFSFFKTDEFRTTVDAFNKWYEEYIPHTKCIFTEKSIHTISDSYSKFIVGSDQTWSPYRNQRKEIFDYFFLNFISESKKKYSYAPSFGTTELSLNYLKNIRISLKQFNKISCREKEIAVKISNLIQKEVTPVVDPTLLLDRTEWEKVCKPMADMPSKYILCYILGEKKSISSFAEKLGKVEKLPVYYILTRPCYLEKENYLSGVGPGEFISLIMNASFVCTDSFHGSIFCINLNIPFYSFTKRDSKDSKNDNDRILLVLKEFGLENRFRIDSDIYFDDSFDSFGEANKLLYERRRQSGNYLRSIIDENI